MIIAIYGLGLIGGSLGRAVLINTEHTVLGCDRDEQVMLKADMLNAYSDRLTDKNIGEADMVIFALNPSAVISVMDGVCAKLKDGATVIDTCGTKRLVIREMERLHVKYPNLSFAGVHPMAGREFSGIEHTAAGLFERAFIIVTPVHTEISALALIKDLFMAVGAQGIEVADCDKHDKMIAYTSQLAHIVSSSYIKNPLSEKYAGFSAGSFRDMTRVARLNPDMWTELFMENRDNLTAAIEDLQTHLSEYKNALTSGDYNRLHSLLAEGAKAKAAADKLLRERRKNDRYRSRIE